MSIQNRVFYYYFAKLTNQKMVFGYNKHCLVQRGVLCRANYLFVAVRGNFKIELIFLDRNIFFR